ncbi:hypothetical protein N7452_004931 [Penicillium brevicompactum]|uniref:Zn(2)-C6 fungal-type domain-containing protein n=1 Tax=Penicillium brevicompactum TaxID=5074 RepID=A0A9W9QHP5_PENBR|nr:hypothetical protein N7452_004931 [Penicillium brevicompactum]
MHSSSRVSVACEACRKRKRKCDGSRPVCSYCLERDRACEYTAEKRIKRRVDPDYVRTLEDEIAMLKEELAQTQSSRPAVLDDDIVHAQAESKRNSEEDGAVAIQDSMTTAIEDQFLDSETLDQLRRDGLNRGLRLVKTAVLAAAALFADDAQSKAIGDEAAAAFDKTSLQLCRELPEISTIQALSIMSWRELGLEQHNMAWMYNSMCASLVIHLGLPVIMTPEEEPVSQTSGELSTESKIRATRLRTLWSSVLMDRIATSLLGRYCLIPWRRIKCSSFLSAVGPSPSLDELAFDSQCRLWFIHDQYMDKIYSYQFSELDSAERSRVLLVARDQLLSFHQQIHPSLLISSTSINNQTPTPAMIYLHISYHTSFILIHRPYLKAAVRNNLTTYRLAIRSVTTAAASIVRLLRTHAKILPLSSAPPFIVHSVLTAAVTHLCNATSTHNTLRSQSIAHFRVCFRALLVMQSRWAKATNALRLLRGLARRWRAMGALPLQYGFEVGEGGGAEQTGGRMAKAESGEEEEGEEERENIDAEREEDGVMVDSEISWSWAANADAVNPNYDGNEMDIFDSIHPETFVLDTDYRQWEWSMGCDI